jgi:hypothetical protein
MKTRRLPISFHACLLLCAALSAVRAEDVVNLDFQDQVPGLPPGFVKQCPEQTRIVVVGSDSEPVDPFGQPDNLSLVMEDDSPEAAARFVFPFSAGAQLRSGIVSWKLYAPVENGFPKPFFTLRMGAGTDLRPLEKRDVFALLEIRPDGSVWIYDQGDGIQISRALDLSESHEIAVHFDIDAKTVEIHLDHAKIYSGTVALSEDFLASPLSDGIRTLDISSGWNRHTGSRVFLDDLKVVETKR